MLPGQGSQEVGMGKELYDESDEIKQLYEKASNVLNMDLKNLMFNSAEETLTETVNTQPALLLSSTAVYIYLQKHGIEPVVTVGHSLGEYSALVASGALSVEDALVLVAKREQLMEEAYPKGKGAMAAVLELSEETIVNELKKIKDKEIVNIANYNT